ncbi:MAG: Lrp/AsnC family transcriptional regulator [Candidatus Bathyarchaeia archaeon]
MIPKKVSLDKKDIELLRILQEDSSTPFVEIAESIGVTDGTIHQRIRKLKKSGILKRFTIQLNQEKVGYRSLAYVLITVNPGNIDSVSKEIINISNVLETHEVHTQGQLLIKLRASSDNEMRDIIVEKIRAIEGVANSELIPVYKVWKEETNLPLAS